jgi:uncharacterized coiled-coil protein SlyX
MDSSDEKEVIVERGSGGFWAIAAIVVVVIVCLIAYGETQHQQQTIAQLNAHETDMSSTIGQLQNQLSDVTNKLNNVQTAQTAATTAANEAAAAAAKARPSRPDPRWNKFQSQLSAQQQQLASEQGAITDAQNAVNQTRTDLEGTINSNHDELTGSIAKTHDELVALEQRGEKNYDEFDLTRGKSNRFNRVGPISLAVRKTDPKHKHYDLAMMVDDNQMQKKNVNLYEPIWIGDSQDSQPLEIVVNKIDKDHIHGYVASAKYSAAEMKPTSAPANTPAPQTPDNSTQAAPSNSPQSN